MEATIFILGFVGLVFLSLIGLVVLEFIKRDKLKTRAHFIYKDNSMRTKKYKNVISKIHFDDLDYNFDLASVVNRKARRNIYYMYGIPDPISFEVNYTGTYDPENMKQILKSNLIKKLFENDDEALSKDTKTILFALLIGFGVTAFAIYQLSQGQGDLILSNTQPNIDLIKNAVLEAIKG